MKIFSQDRKFDSMLSVFSAVNAQLAHYRLGTVLVGFPSSVSKVYSWFKAAAYCFMTQK